MGETTCDDKKKPAETAIADLPLKIQKSLGTYGFQGIFCSKFKFWHSWRLPW